MNSNKTNDWFAARLLNSDKPVDFLITEGITAENSSLQDKSFYKSKPKVQEAFKKPDGAFDEDTYDKFYNDISTEFTYLNSVDTENYILDAYEKSGSNFSTNFGTVIDPKIDVERVINPQDQSFGLTNTNEWSTPTKSRREMAQKNQYFDNDTGKWSDKTVNEEGILGLLKNKSLVYASWDEDGTHIDPFTGKEVKHAKGEWKTDEFGNYYAETINNEEAIDKQFVTWSEVLTDDESPWNKIDIFDSDDIDSNIFRTLLKGTAIVGSSVLFPSVGATLFYTTAAVNLTRVLPQVSKSIAAFFGADEFDTLNKWDNTMRRFGRSSSDYSQEHFFSLENILNLAIDSYMQLGTQRAIAMIPQKLGIGNKAAKQMATAEAIQRLKLAQSGKVSQEVIEALTKSTEAYRTANKVFNNASKISTAISRGYLITTSVEDVYNQAKSYGFDSQTAGLISLATYAGIGTLFQTDYFRGMLYNTPDYEVSRDIKLLTRQWLKTSSDKMKKDLATATTEVAKQSKLKLWGNTLVNHIKNHVGDVKSGRFGIISGAINEGLEEVSEEVTQDIAFQIGKSWQSLKETFTGNTYSNEYSYAESDPLARYGMSLFGGALGGAIFKLTDRLHLQKNAYKQWKDMMGGDNSQLMKEIVYHVSQGRTDMILKQIEKLQESPVLSTSISAFTGEPTTNADESQNAVIFNMFKKAITDIDSFLNNNNLAIDYERFGDIELLRGVRTAWLTSVAGDNKGIQDSLFEDYQKRITDILNIQSEIQAKRTSLSDNAKQEEVDAVKAETSKLQKVLDFKIDQVRKLVSGQDDSYIGRLMLESNKDILDKITPTSKEGLSKYLYGVEYSNLPTIYKNEVDKQVKEHSSSGLTEINYMSAWNIYKNITGDESIKTTFSNINDIFKNFVSLESLSPEDLQQFLVVREALKIMQPLWNDAQVLNLFYKMKGIDTPVFDFQDDGSIETDLIGIDYDRVINDIYDSWEGALESAKSKLDENPTIFDNWINDYSAGNKNDELTNQEGFSLLTQTLSRDDFNKLVKNIYGALDENPMTLQHGILGRTMISSKVVDNLINSITSKVDDTNKVDLIQQQYNLLKSQGNKYFMSNEIHTALDQLNELLDLVESVSEGSNIERRTEILDIPFGANNFLNKVFKEKGIDLDLSQISPNTVNAIKTRISHLKGIINLLVTTDQQNKGAVITTEKKIGIKYAEFKLKTIQNLLENANLPKDLKSKLENLNFTITDVNSLTSDEEYVNIAANYRNIILQFEREFASYWASSDDSKKIDLINSIVTVFNKDLTYDTGSLNADILSKDGNLLNDSTSFMYLMSCSFGNSDLVTGIYKENIKESDKFPFDSQEDIILNVSKFLLRDSKKDIKLWIDAIISDKGAEDSKLIKLYRAIKVVCSGGTGKTSTILPSIFNIISKVIPNKNVIFASNTNNQINTIKESINDASTVLISDIINDSINKENFKTKYENTIIFIDECTNIGESDLKVLDNLSEEYNIDIVYLGDVKQHSNGISIDGVVCPMTTQLTDSKRASTDVSRKNNNIFEQLFTQDREGRPELNPLKLDTFTYWESENNLEGIKFENPGTLTNEFIRNFYEIYNLDPKVRVLVFSNNLSSLDINSLSTTYNITFADNFAAIQGAEWDYTLTDINLNVEGDRRTQDYLKVYNNLKDIYTLFTRHKHGLISLQPLVLKDLTPDTIGLYVADSENNEFTIFPPVESGIVNNVDALNEFIDYKIKVLDNTNIVESEYVNDINKEQELPSKVEIAVRPTKVSLAQVASGFLLKKNFTDDFIKTLGLSKESYGISRNILYSILTSNGDVEHLKEQLPESLRNGQFLIKVEYSTIDDLYDIGNLHRDNKELKGIHPWIVYHIDGQDDKDIYLGMFHSALTSGAADSEISQTSNVINNLSNGMLTGSAPKYFNIPSKLNISRSSNIVDIQNKETNDGSYIGLTYSDGKVIGSSIGGENKRFDFLESSLSIYFRRGNENIVKVNSILEELNNLRSLYSKFYKLGIESKLYTTDVEPVKELLHYNRRNNSWGVRGVPDLEDKFVIFTKLQLGEKVTSPGAYLQDTSNSYLKSLQERSKQLVEIIQVLESGASDDFKKSKINEILSNRILFTSVPLAFDPDISTDTESFNEIIDNITYNVFRGSQRSRKAYNDAITHQFGYALRRFAALVKYGDQLKLANKSSSWFDKNDLSTVKNIWDNYKERLVNAYKQWSGISNADESALLSFLTETFTKVYSEKGSKTVPVFMNNNSNLLQTTDFRNFLQDMYMSKNWSNIVAKLNTIKYFKLSPDIQVMFEGYMFPYLIKDNGINIITKGDALNIQDKSTFILNSKVIQQGRIFVYGNDSLKSEDFTEYSSNVSQSVEVIDNSKQEVKQEVKKEDNSITEFDSASFKKSLVSIGRSGGKKIELSDRKQLSDLINTIYQNNNISGNIIEKAIIQFTNDGDFNTFTQTIETLSKTESENIRTILDNILAIVNNYTDLC